MLNLNKVMVAGNLGADPETRFFPDGTPACNYRIATTNRWTDRDTGEAREHTEWISVQTTGKRAEIDQKYLKKGTGVYVEGRLKTTSWSDKTTGEKRYMTLVAADVVQFTSAKPKDAAEDASDSSHGYGGYDGEQPA